MSLSNKLDKVKEVENKFNISFTDRSCKYAMKYNCDRCISPCGNCTTHMCEQCSYRYSTLSENLIKKYSKEELEELEGYKDICPYAEIALYSK